MRSDRQHDERLAARFLREAHVLGQLRHPNLVTVYDAGADADGRLFLVTEYLEGRTLSALLEERGRLASPAVLEIVRQVAEALAAAHAQGVVHRDLKPDNLFLAPLPRGRELVKLLDFGLAGLADPADGERLGAVGKTVGTPAYMAPEQFRGALADARCDLYSLGCIAYQLLTGALPLTGRSLEEVAFCHCECAPAPPDAHVPLSPAVSGLVMRLLAKDPVDRPARAVDLLDSLETHGLVGSRPELTAEEPPISAVERRTWWSRAVRSAGAALVAVSASGFSGPP